MGADLLVLFTASFLQVCRATKQSDTAHQSCQVAAEVMSGAFALNYRTRKEIVGPQSAAFWVCLTFAKARYHTLERCPGIWFQAYRPTSKGHHQLAAFLSTLSPIQTCQISGGMQVHLHRASHLRSVCLSGSLRLVQQSYLLRYITNVSYGQ